MLKADAKLYVRSIPLECLQVTEFVSCFPEKVVQYTRLLQEHPGENMDPIMVMPSSTHPGMYAIKNGKHRFMAYILASREEALCLVVDEQSELK